MKKFILILLVFALFISASFAESIWVMCQPDSSVNVRMAPRKTSISISDALCADEFNTDGKIKNGYIYLPHIASESGEGWISTSYIVYAKPIPIMQELDIYSNGRIAVWKCIGGKRRCWVNNGDSVMVYYISNEWSITNKGFIRTKYLGVDYEQLSRTLENTSTHDWPDELYFEDD